MYIYICMYVITSGLRSLYVGMSAHMLTNVPWSATWWGTYEGTLCLCSKVYLVKRRSKVVSYVVGHEGTLCLCSKVFCTAS
jgi:hypothetical protein